MVGIICTSRALTSVRLDAGVLASLSVLEPGAAAVLWERTVTDEQIGVWQTQSSRQVWRSLAQEGPAC